MEMGWGADKDEKGKKGGHTMTKLQDLSSHMISQFFRIWSVMGATHLGYQRPSGNLFIGWAHLNCHAATSISS